jgi:hypothetical protein
VPARDKQINEMIGTTMNLAQAAGALELPLISCLYRMILLELTNQVDDQPAAKAARNQINVPVP